MDLIFSETDVAIMRGQNVSQQKKVVMSKLNAFNGKNIWNFFWKFIGIKDDEEEQEEKEEKDEKEEKQDTDEKINAVSMVIDFNYAKNDISGVGYYGQGMCSKGHGKFLAITAVACSQCGGKEDVFNCMDCNDLNNLENALCVTCRDKNMLNLENEWKMDELKSRVIRNELIKQPTLSLDLFCGLPRKTGLNKLMDDILALTQAKKADYILFLIDVDNLKALNSSLGHEGADNVIQKVGKCLKKFTTQVNNGKWKPELYRGWCFRQGGDEFAVVIQAGRGYYASDNKRLWPFYSGWKGEINNIEVKKVNEVDMQKGRKMLKERGRKQIKTAVNGVNMTEQSKKQILSIYDKDVNVKKIVFNVNKIGISVGLFIPSAYSEEKSWIECAEAAQDSAKELEGKNEICIYFEAYNDGKGGVIPTDRTEDCLKAGCNTIW